MAIQSDIQKLDLGSVITLWVIDYTDQEGGDVTRLSNCANELGNDVVWQGETYNRFPIEGEGFDMNTQGTIPRPKLRVANVTQDMGALIRNFDDLLGAKVTRKRTFVKYLDASNFTGGTNDDADPEMHFPDEIWYINQKTLENKVIIEFELTSPFDVDGVKLPRRQLVQNMCQWVYRSAECSYAGGAVATINDVPTGDGALDDCGKRIKSCKLRFGEHAELPFGGFPGAGLIR